jgi:hypothetical protein
VQNKEQVNAGGESSGDINIRAKGVGQKAGKTLAERGVAKPKVELEGSGIPTTDNDRGETKIFKTGDDVSLEGGIKVVMASQVTGGSPPVHATKPAGPMSSRIGVQLGLEFGKKGGILGQKRKDP